MRHRDTGRAERALPVMYTFNNKNRRDLWRSSCAIPEKEGNLWRPSAAIPKTVLFSAHLRKISLHQQQETPWVGGRVWRRATVAAPPFMTRG